MLKTAGATVTFSLVHRVESLHNNGPSE